MSEPIFPEAAHPETVTPEGAHPGGEGTWTLLQDQVVRAMWQQEMTDDAGGIVSRFWIVNPPEALMYDSFDEAEAMFEALAGDD